MPQRLGQLLGHAVRQSRQGAARALRGHCLDAHDHHRPTTAAREILSISIYTMRLRCLKAAAALACRLPRLLVGHAPAGAAGDPPEARGLGRQRRGSLGGGFSHGGAHSVPIPTRQAGEGHAHDPRISGTAVGGRSGAAAASGAAGQPLAMGHGALRRGAFRREFLPPVGKRRDPSLRSRQGHISRRHPGRHQAVSAPSFALSGAGVKPQKSKNGLPTLAAGVAAGSEETAVTAERYAAYHVEPVPRPLMGAFVAAHHYAVRARHWPRRGCGVRAPPDAATFPTRAVRSRNDKLTCHNTCPGQRHLQVLQAGVRDLGSSELQ